MKIELKPVTIAELADGYQDNDDLGVRAYSGQLDVRPPYQREFVYKAHQRDAVINTVTKAFPLNVMYWAVGEDGKLEIIDGQQRTISICQFIEGDFAVKIGSIEQPRYFHNLQDDEKDSILNYKLMVYLCSGDSSEKLEWFRTINIAGEELTQQELRNAVFSGRWVSAAKPYFSKNGCPAYVIGSKYLSGSPIRQDYLETAISWLNKGDIDGYMATHQDHPNANELWLYFQAVIAWVEATYPVYRKEMKSVPWGVLYNQFSGAVLDAEKLEEEVSRLMLDDSVERKAGIYSYLLDGKERHLNIRAFSPAMRREAYERQQGICPACKKHFELDAMEADHVTPWHEGGKTTADNCQMLCLEDNRRKGGR